MVGLGIVLVRGLSIYGRGVVGVIGDSGFNGVVDDIDEVGDGEEVLGDEVLGDEVLGDVVLGDAGDDVLGSDVCRDGGDGDGGLYSKFTITSLCGDSG